MKSKPVQPDDRRSPGQGSHSDIIDSWLVPPSRRDVLKWGGACGAACLFAAQPVSGSSKSDGVVVRREARHWKPLDDRSIQCTLCPWRCRVTEGQRGRCRVRENRDGKYETLVYGALCSANPDPIEKKPLFHYLPGTKAFSVAAAGCNITCCFCQNWQISQVGPEDVRSQAVSIDQLVRSAKASRCRSVAYTYSEPIVSYEYMFDSAESVREAGLGAVMISNGFINPEPLKTLCDRLSAIKVDFKGYSNSFYQRQCAGELKPVLKALEVIREKKVWLELVTLVIPTLNDSEKEIRELSRWVLKNLGSDVPLHFTRFHPSYRLTNLPRTPVKTVEKCRQIALDAGLDYVYMGNVPGHPGENTWCPSCGGELITRSGFRVIANRIKGGKCPTCGEKIAGIWSPENGSDGPRK